MKHLKMGRLIVFAGAIILLNACQKSEDLEPRTEEAAADASLKSAQNAGGFVHGIVVNVNGDDYYFAGAPDGAGGAFDIPGHSWVQSGPDRLVGKHYNTGPFGAASWWSSDASDGALLYIVHAVIDEWTQEKAEKYASRGFPHYHELVSVSDGTLHPSLVVWLKHTAVTSFTLDGGPGAPNPPYEHWVTPGVDLGFPNNYLQPYNP